MYKQVIGLFLIATVTVVYGNLGGWFDCGSHQATVHAIRVTNCSHTPCIFVRGQMYRLEVDATARANSMRLPFATVANVLGINMTLIEGNACDYLQQGSCPALDGNFFSFSIDYTVPTTLPPIPTNVYSLVWNDFGEQGICIRVAVQLT